MKARINQRQQSQLLSAVLLVLTAVSVSTGRSAHTPITAAAAVLVALCNHIPACQPHPAQGQRPPETRPAYQDGGDDQGAVGQRVGHVGSLPPLAVGHVEATGGVPGPDLRDTKTPVS